MDSEMRRAISDCKSTLNRLIGIAFSSLNTPLIRMVPGIETMVSLVSRLLTVIVLADQLDIT